MKKILIVEDDRSLRKALSDKLEQESYDVIEAENGLKAFEAINDKNPDLILLDIVMPKLDGISLLQKVKREIDDFNIPVIILTNLSSNEELEIALSEGVRDYLIKSDWKIEEVIEKIKEKIG